MAIRFHSSLLLLSVAALLASGGCKKENTAGDTQPAAPQSAATRIPPKPVPAFDADRAFKDVETQVAFGPRVPNTPAHDKQVAFLKERLSALTPDLNIQTFEDPAYSGSSLKLSNVIASFNPSAQQRILILTHYDSRPWADEDPDKANKLKPVPAANDGASGTALLLELARVMKDNPPPIGVDILLDDGEDYGKYSVDSLDRYFLGAKYFVKNRAAGFQPMFAILLDMVGDKNASFTQEGFSTQYAAQYTSEIWRTAKELNLNTFKQQPGSPISDDHLPFLEAQIPTVDIIDGDLVGHAATDPNRKYWHTIDDLPKHVSAETLGQVGKLLLTLIYDRLPKDIGTPNLP